MKKGLILACSMTLLAGYSFAADTVFDSMGNAKEVKLSPAINTTSTSGTAKTTTTKVSSYTSSASSIKEEKFNNAITNLDDAQVELRQELAQKTAEYNTALNEKQKAIQNCKTLKKEVKTLTKNMKNVETAKKNINKNIESK